MKRRYKILGGILGFLAVAIGVFALVLSHSSACPAPQAPATGQAMNAVQYHCYGGPEVLKLEQVARPVPEADQLLVKVHAAGVNPLDWHYMRGEPYIMRVEAGFGAPNEPQWASIFRAPWKRSAPGSRASSRVMRCSADAMAPSPNTSWCANRAPWC